MVNIQIFDNFINRDISGLDFKDYPTPNGTFKGIALLHNDDDIVAKKLLEMYPDYRVEMNFIRRSPKGQVEPNYIHTDEMHGDLTAVLYLNGAYPVGAGTYIYDDKGEAIMAQLYMKQNRLVIFPSKQPHSRVKFDNFDVRMVQVLFLKKILK